MNDQPVPIVTDEELAALETEEARIAALLPSADCGCRTYWVWTSEEAGTWEASHGLGCTRKPIRRREAIEHARGERHHDERTRTTKRR